MRNFMETIVIAGFVLFIVGGCCLVAVQFIGLISGNSYLMVHAEEWFSWIYPCAAITGALCYLLSYRKKKN